ncbi:hypothetical protein [Maridesulfovibrio sp.]|uniref:hypothetical protein n=1 Tax=Maridesulfovibrio sp. TaxID=2795000 RepID=UPI002A189ED0|nr:hypothetical protein [Maridesulfovibrio sp.]
MDSKLLGCHVSDMMSACCALRVLSDKLQLEDRYGEAFILDSIRRVVSESANAFDEYDMQVQMGKSGRKKPAPVLELVRK